MTAPPSPPLPKLVERELDGYVGCGVLARGFARVRCGACGHELLVPFSCKRRGLCPSCTARRAEDTAAHLVDHVLPRVPSRQWVFTFPIPVRLALSRRTHLVTAVLQACLRVLFSWQRRRLRRRGVKRPSCGAITFVQRFGSALQLNVHFHVLVPNGGFDDDGVFVADEAPNDDDIRRIMVPAGRRCTDSSSTTTTIAGARSTASSNRSMRRRPPLSLCSFPAMRGGRRCRRSSKASRCMPPRG
jgi:hypothetical protein